MFKEDDESVGTATQETSSLDRDDDDWCTDEELERSAMRSAYNNIIRCLKRRID